MKYLLWDFDGTLGYREGMWAGALAEVLQRQDILVAIEQLRPYLQTGFPWHRADLVRARGISADEWWHGLNPIFENVFLAVGVAAERIPTMIREMRTTYCDPAHWKLFDDTIPALEYLATEGWRHIMLSNHVPELLHILHALHISHYFEYIFNSAETGCEKPHPQAFQAVRQVLDTPEYVWMIGDSYEADIAGAEAAGIRAILVRKKHERSTLYCASLADLEAVLLSV